MKCEEHGKVYRGGKNWKFAKGRFSNYTYCPECIKNNDTLQRLPVRTDLRYLR